MFAAILAFLAVCLIVGVIKVVTFALKAVAGVLLGKIKKTPNAKEGILVPKPMVIDIIEGVKAKNPEGAQKLINAFNGKSGKLNMMMDENGNLIALDAVVADDDSVDEYHDDVIRISKDGKVVVFD